MFVNFMSTTGSASALQFLTSYPDTAQLLFRKTIDSNRVTPWRAILTELNIGSYALTPSNYASTLDSRYVNASGDTMTGRLAIITGQTECGIRFGGNTTNADFVGRYGTYVSLFNLQGSVEIKLRDNGHVEANQLLDVIKNGRTLTIGSDNADWCHYQTDAPNGHWFNKRVDVQGEIYAGANYNQRVFHQGFMGSGSGLDADMLDGLHLSDIRGEGYAMQGVWIDASGLDQNTWYPVTLPLSVVSNTRIEVLVGLSSSTKPSWSTHRSGFSTHVIWEANGHGWGTTPINRTVYVADYDYAGSNPVRGIGQLGNSSTEYFYVRGGGRYYVRTSNGVVPVLRTSTYTVHSQSIGPTTTAPAEIHRDNARIGDNVASATRLQGTYSLWGQSFYGNNVSGNMTGVGNINSAAAPINTIYASNWYRSIGATGWYNETYGGGWHMDNATWIKSWNKPVHIAHVINEGASGFGVGLRCYGGSHTSIEVQGGAYTMGLGCHSNGSWYWWRGTSSGKGYVMQYDGTTWAFNGVIKSSTGMYSDGYMSCMGQNTGSDARLKNVLGAAAIPIEVLLGAPAVRFAWNASAPQAMVGRVAVGTIAQYWQEHLPEVVGEMYNGRLGVNYGALGWIAVHSLARYAYDGLTDHERRIKTLEKENNKLKNRIAELERRVVA